MRSLRSSFALAAALGLSAASVVHAQRPAAPRRPAQAAPAPNAQGAPPAGAPGDMGPGMARGRAGGPGMRFGGPAGSPAARLLGLRQQLELTDDQVKRLETLQQAAQPKSSETDQLRARADLMDAMKGDGNLTAARAALDKMNRIRTDEQIARMKTQQDARAVLTAAQKTKLDNFRGQMGRAMRDRQGRPGNNRQFMRQRMGRGPQGQGFGPGFAPGAVALARAGQADRAAARAECRRWGRRDSGRGRRVVSRRRWDRSGFGAREKSYPIRRGSERRRDWKPLRHPGGRT